MFHDNIHSLPFLLLISYNLYKAITNQRTISGGPFTGFFIFFNFSTLFNFNAHIIVLFNQINFLPFICAMDVYAVVLISIIEWENIGTVFVHKTQPANFGVR